MTDHRLALAGAVLAALALAGCGDSAQQPQAVATAEDAAPLAPALPPVTAAEPAEVATPTAVGGQAELPAPAPVIVAPPPEPAAVAAAVPEPVEPVAAAAEAPEPVEPAPVAAEAAPPERTLEERLATADPAGGAVYLMQCEICHSIGADDRPASVGPSLFELVGAPVGRDPAFNYSPAFVALRAEGATWTPERLDAFLAAPGAEIPGTRMSFGGFADPDTRANVIAWLATLVPSTTVVDDAPPAPQIIGVETAGLDPVSFLAVQADVGADQYASLGCGACHGDDMRGRSAPALVGPEFGERWFGRPVADFVEVLRTMPPGETAPLPDARYLELTAVILTANGFMPGSSPLRASAETLAATGFYQLVPPSDPR